MRQPLSADERQSIKRAELRAVLHAIHNRQPGKRLHIVTDSVLVYAGLVEKCEKWKRHGWRGSRGPLVHVSLWEDLWLS